MPTTLLVPGAWMGAWIWKPTAEHLSKSGHNVDVITLAGLEENAPAAAIGQIRLEDHVQQVASHIASYSEPAILISHSYSAMVTALVADRLPENVAGLVHFGGFLPIDGRSLLDDWGENPKERANERDEIERAGNLWLPPDREMLEYEESLSPSDRAFLAERFTAHPGSTVTDPASLGSPVETQPTTYVAQSTSGFDQAWKDAPPVAQAATNWRRRHIHSGHWPMISNLQGTVDLITDEIGHYTARIQGM